MAANFPECNLGGIFSGGTGRRHGTIARPNNAAIKQ